MLQITITARGIGGLALTILSVCIVATIGLIVAYITNPNWHQRVNRFFLLLRLGIKSCGKSFFHGKTLAIRTDRIASCVLGNQTTENGVGGIVLIDHKGDGNVVKEIIGKEFVRRTDNENNVLYFYFTFTEQIAENFRNRPIALLVEYLDRDRGEANSTKDDGKRGLHLKYDSIGEEFEARWKMAGEIGFTDSKGGWKWAGFNISDGYFHRRQNEVGDFRIGCRYANPKRDYNLYLRRVMAIIP